MNSFLTIGFKISPHVFGVSQRFNINRVSPSIVNTLNDGQPDESTSNTFFWYHG